MVRGLCEKHYNAAYYVQNRDRILRRVKAEYEKNPNPAKARSAAWNAAHSEEKKTRDTEWRKRNAGRVRRNANAWVVKNRKKIAARSAALRKERNVEYREREARWRELNRETARATLRKWKKNNIGKVRADDARRRAQKHSADVSWANPFFISEIYDLARLRTKHTGIKWHVDHVVPLRHPLVCGLHWEKNLQVITAPENFAKNNRYWPDMPQ